LERSGFVIFERVRLRIANRLHRDRDLARELPAATAGSRPYDRPTHL
jgi:hypothetical protein